MTMQLANGAAISADYWPDSRITNPKKKTRDAFGRNHHPCWDRERTNKSPLGQQSEPPWLARKATAAPVPSLVRTRDRTVAPLCRGKSLHTLCGLLHTAMQNSAPRLGLCSTVRSSSRNAVKHGKLGVGADGKTQQARYCTREWRNGAKSGSLTRRGEAACGAGRTEAMFGHAPHDARRPVQ